MVYSFIDRKLCLEFSCGNAIRVNSTSVSDGMRRLSAVGTSVWCLCIIVYVCTVQRNWFKLNIKWQYQYQRFRFELLLLLMSDDPLRLNFSTFAFDESVRQFYLVFTCKPNQYNSVRTVRDICKSTKIRRQANRVHAIANKYEKKNNSVELKFNQP